MTTGNLFDIPASLLSWLPGETLFSLISRHHFFSGQVRAERTCELFFGHPRSGSQHDLPSRLAHFVSRTKGSFGGVELVAVHHTLLAYYKALLPPTELNNAISCLAGDSVAHLKLRLGILTSRFRANHPLKCCTACMADDRSNHGWTYWHLDHQYPGVWICQQHGLLLQESTLKATGVERFQWHLPAEEHCRPWPADKWQAILEGHAALQSLSRLVIELTGSSSGQRIDTSRLHEIYKTELARRGWVTAGGSLRMAVVAASFLEHVKHLRVLPEMMAFPATEDEASIQIGRLLRLPRSGTHPLRHMVLINWLFGSVEQFRRAEASTFNAPDAQSSSEFSAEQEAADSSRNSPRSQLISLMSVQKQSARMAAKAVGIDVGTAMSWAAQAGLSVSRRPKKLSGELRRRTIDELRSGLDKAVVASNAQVSIVAITKLLLSEVGLHAAWCQSRKDRARDSAREVWRLLLHSHRGVGTKVLRALEPAAYAWLYRNDRAWLELHKPGLQKVPASTGGLHVKWDERDQAMSAEVAHAVRALCLASGGNRIKLWQIYQAVPALKAKLAVLDRLPLTRRAINLATRRRGSAPSEPELFD